MIGKVKFWSNKKGFGFIIVEGQKEDVFVHHSNIKTDDEFKSLVQGQEVEFDIQTLKDGRQSAVNVLTK